MPEKDGDDDKKSTKSVVNKKQKQMMGEEGYDIARDMGKVKPSKDKKDGTSYPPNAEMKKTQKVNKGPSAFERVKAKYGKSVMNVGKKKVKEELDLTQVAEALGGYIVEANGKKKNDKDKEIEKSRSLDRFMRGDDPFNPPSEQELAFQDLSREAEKAGEKVRPPEKGELGKGGPVKKERSKNVKFSSGAKGKFPSGSPEMGGESKKFSSRNRIKDSEQVSQAEKTAKKVQRQKDQLSRRVSDRSALRGTKSAQRQAMATGRKTTGSLSKGDLKFPGDDISKGGTGAYSVAKYDADIRKNFRKLGATGDFGATMSTKARREAQAKRDQRMSDLGVDDVSLGKYSKLPSTADPFADYMKKRAADTAKMDKKYSTKTTGGRDLSTMNPDELRRRGIGGDGSGSTEGGAGASGSTAGGTGGGTGGGSSSGSSGSSDGIPYSKFSELAKKAASDVVRLNKERDALKNKGNLGDKQKQKLRDLNKQIQGAQSMEKGYTAQSQGVGQKNPIVALSGNEPTGQNPRDKSGREKDFGAGKETSGRETRSGAYLRGLRGEEPGGKIKNQEKGGSIVKGNFAKIQKFMKANPTVAGLASYDLGKGILGKIYNKVTSARVPAVVGGRAGFRSAKQ